MHLTVPRRSCQFGIEREYSDTTPTLRVISYFGNKAFMPIGILLALPATLVIATSSSKGVANGGSIYLFLQLQVLRYCSSNPTANPTLRFFQGALAGDDVIFIFVSSET